MNMSTNQEIIMNNSNNKDHYRKVNRYQTQSKPIKLTLNLQAKTIDSPDSIFSRFTKDKNSTIKTLLTNRLTIIRQKEINTNDLLRKKLLFDTELLFDSLGTTNSTSRLHNTISKFLDNNNNNNNDNYTEQNRRASINRSSQRNSTKHNTIILSHKPRKKLFKNTEDLFNQTLNIKNNRNNKDITNKLFLETQIRLLKRRHTKNNKNDRLPIFNSTQQLNNYLIGQYHLGNNPGENGSRRKMNIAKETFTRIKNKERNDIKSKNENNILPAMNNTMIDNKALLLGIYNYNIDDNEDNEDYTNEKVQLRLKEYYDNKMKESLCKVNKYMDKLGSISNHHYEKLDKVNLVNYHNLSRVIKLQKIKIKANMTYDPIKKNQLKEDEDKVILACKFGRPLGTKANVKNKTNLKYKCLQGAFFGVPV